MTDPGHALGSLAAALDAQAIPYMIGGSMASGIFGVYRSSLAVDLVADIRLSQVAGLAQKLSGEFYADADMMRDTITAARSFNPIHFASSYKFDIFPLSADSFQRGQFARRQVKEIVLGSAKLALPVATAEDTLLMKLVWYRAGGEVSERQWNDVRGILAVQRERLDRSYLHQWAAHLKVADLLDAVETAEA